MIFKAKKNKYPIKPLAVSVIIPAYNEERKISKCLDALLKQTYKNLEIFVVDDGSTDNTVERVKRYTKRHKNIRLLKQKQQGPGAAKNKAAKKAKGNILVFVDSDEYPLPDYIEKLTNPIRKGKAKTSIGAWKLADPKSPWARCRFKDTHKLRQHALNSGVFRAIDKKTFVKLGGFNPKKGYSDDRIKNNFKRARVDNAIFDHDVDSTLKELYLKRKWIGKSLVANPKGMSFKIKTFGVLLLGILATAALVFSLKLLFLLAIFFLLSILFKAASKTLFYKDERLLLYYPFYFLICAVGMTHGLFEGMRKRV